MKKSKFLMNRYVQLLYISIFFIIPLHSQISLAKELRDSVESLNENFPQAQFALPIYKRIYELSKKEGDRNMQLYSKIYVSFFHSNLGNDIEANEEAENAYKIAQDSTGVSTNNLILTYQLLHRLEKKKGNLIQANELIKKSVNLELTNGLNNVEVGLSYLDIATGYRLLGDFENAINYSNTAYKLFKDTPDSIFHKDNDKSLRLFRSLQIRGLVNKDIKLYDDAIADYQRSLGFLKQSSQYNKKEGLLSRIDCFARMADAYLLKNDLINASRILKKFELLIETETYNKFRFYELSAIYALKKRDFSSASSNIQLAIELATKELQNSKEFPEIARLNMIYGDYFIRTDSLIQAIEKYQLGLQYFDNNLDDHFSNNTNISLISEGTQTLQLLVKKAEALLSLFTKTNKKNHLRDGISTYNTAIDLIDKMKSDFINDGSKYRVAEIAASIFPKALEANFALYQIEKNQFSLNSIFNIIEKNKAEILFQNVSSKYNLLTSSLSDELVQKGIDLKYNISYYSKLFSEESLSPEGNKSKIEKYKNKLFKLNEELDFYDQKIKDEYPEFYKFKNGIGTETTIFDLQSALQNEQIIIEYFQTEDHIYTLSISKDKSSVNRKSLAEIEPILSDYLKLISQPPSRNIADLDNLNKLSITLAEKLVLKDENYNSGIKKIIIVPDGILNKLPFETLILDNDGKMLIEQSNVAYNYSARQFLENIDSPILKDPDVLCQTPTFAGLPSAQRSCNSTILGELPYAKNEFDYLESNFSGSFFAKDSASSTTLKENFADFEIIHLATHACVNDKDPMLSQIYFSDGSMTNYDIQNLNSRPELVVLSACNTASGQIQDGEGVIGLSRGFFEAGVKGMQSSLWSIDDLSSSKIVTGMYHHLKNGESKSEALRLSKLDYLKQADKLRSHPYYWAAMIHIGNDNPISFSTNDKHLTLISILAIFILGIGLFLYFSRGKAK